MSVQSLLSPCFPHGTLALAEERKLMKIKRGSWKKNSFWYQPSKVRNKAEVQCLPTNGEYCGALEQCIML